MKHIYFFKTVLLFLAIFFSASSIYSQNHADRKHFGVYPGLTVSLESSRRFVTEVNPGPSLAFRYSYLWDEIFCSKDALGVFADVNLMWNPLSKRVRDLYKKVGKMPVPSYLNTYISTGLAYNYYLGKAETWALFGEVGGFVGMRAVLKKSKTNLTVGPIVGVGVRYNEWVSLGVYYQFMKLFLKEINDTEFMYNDLNLLHVKVGFHF